MPNTPETPSADTILDQLSEIQDEAKKNKVQLTPEVQAYIREHFEAVQRKLANREEVTEDDMRFMQDVRLWVSLPEEWREKYKGIEEMMQSEEVQDAKKRQITLKQWLDLLHVAKAAGKHKEWIDETFKFPGGGDIETFYYLFLSDCTSLTNLPTGLKVNGPLDLSRCTSLTFLPPKLEVNGGLMLEGCTSLASLPIGLRVSGGLHAYKCSSLKSLPDDLQVKMGLMLEECTSLISLPNNLKVKGDLVLFGCTSLTSLPAELEVEKNLDLSKNLNEQVKKDALRLKKEGKIKGEIKYK